MYQRSIFIHQKGLIKVELVFRGVSLSSMENTGWSILLVQSYFDPAALREIKKLNL